MSRLVVISLLLFSLVELGCASTTSKPNEADENLQEGCHTPLGFIPEGGSSIGYLSQMPPAGQTCVQGELTCQDGVWSGAYIFPSCTISLH